MTKYFLDSNICIYAFSTFDINKQNTAITLLNNNFIISPQVIIATYNALKRKKIVLPTQLDDVVIMLLNTATIVPFDNKIISNGLFIKNKYQLSFLDSLIISAALMANCTVLYSEDMHQGLLIENSLSIVNPFV